MNDPRTINLPDGSTFNWNVNPDLNPERSVLSLEWNKEFIQDDVQITVSVNGQVVDFISPPNSTDFNVNFQATRRF